MISHPVQLDICNWKNLGFRICPSVLKNKIKGEGEKGRGMDKDYKNKAPYVVLARTSRSLRMGET